MPPAGLPRLVDRLRDAVAPPVGDVPDGELLGRYARDRDQAAFAELVRRRGPLVLGVCGRVLRDTAAAEDAFQATFLVLARKAGRIRRPDQLANWLFGVADRVARAARRRVLRRRAVEVSVGTPPDRPAEPADASTDWRDVLHEEVLRLPAHYRAAVLMCDLEGRPRREAARSLGIPDGTLSNRLTRARTLLGRRLLRRGVGPAGLVAGWAVTPDLAAATIAIVFADRPPAPIASLATEVCKPMIPLRLLMVSAVACAAAVGLARTAAVSPQPHATSPPEPAARKPVADPPDPVPQAGPHAYQVAYSPDSRLLAVAQSGRHVIIRGGGGGNAVEEVEGEHTVTLFNAATGQVVRALTGPTRITRGLAFTADGKTLFAACDDGVVYSWEVATGKAGPKLEVGAGRCPAVILSSDGKTLATAHVQDPPIDKEFPTSWVQLWDVRTLKPGRRFQCASRLRCEDGVRFSPDGKVLAAICNTPFDGGEAFAGVVEWDVATGEELRRVPTVVMNKGGKTVNTSLTYTADGKWLVVGGGEVIPEDGTNGRQVGHIWVFDRTTGKLHKTLAENTPGYFMDVTTSADGKRVFAGTTSAERPGVLPDGTKFSALFSEVWCWDATTWERGLSAWGHPGMVNALAASPDGRRVALADGSGVWLFDAKSGGPRGGLLKYTED